MNDEESNVEEKSTNSAESESFQRELQRIKFRQTLMSIPGGVQWLVHIGKLFGFSERFLGPGNFGMPQKLMRSMHQLGW